MTSPRKERRLFTVRALYSDVVLAGPPEAVELLSTTLSALGPRPVPAGRPVDIEWMAVAPGVWDVHLGQSGTFHNSTTAEALSETMGAINRCAARQLPAEVLGLHAGVFATDRGAIAVCGASGAGKSTLVAAAVRHGHQYVADEVCAVRGAAFAAPEVLPYLRPIGLRREGAAALGIRTEVPHVSSHESLPWNPEPEAIAHDPVRLSAIALVRRQDGAADVHSLGAAAGMVALAEHLMRDLDHDGFHQLAALARTVPIVEVRYRNAAGAVQALTEIC